MAACCKLTHLLPHHAGWAKRWSRQSTQLIRTYHLSKRVPLAQIRSLNLCHTNRLVDVAIASTSRNGIPIRGLQASTSATGTPPISSLELLHALVDNPQLLDVPVVEVAGLLSQVVDQQYGALMQEFTWIQPIYMVARLQLQLMDLFHVRFEPVTKHDGFALLLEKLSATCDETPVELLVQVLQNLLLLGFDQNHSYPRTVMRRCRESIMDYDIHTLGEFGNAIRLLPKGFFFQCLHQSMTRYAQLIPAVEADCTVRGLVDMADAFRNLHMYSSMDLLIQSSVTFMRIAQECSADEMRSPDEINALSYIARRLYRSGHFLEQAAGTRTMPRHLGLIAAEACARQIDKYDARHLAEMCTSLKPLRLFTPELAALFEKRALELLSTSKGLAEICNLFHCLTTATPLNVRRSFESALYSKMDDLDPLTLTNLADAFHYMGMDNKDIVGRYQELVLARAKGLTQGPSHLFQSQIRYILSTNFNDKAMRQKMFKLVVEFVQENQVVLSYYTPSITNFCLLHFDGRLHPTLVEQFLRSIPKWRMASMKKLLEELSSSRRVGHPQIQMVLAELQHQIYNQIVEKPEMIRTVGELTGFVHTMALHAYYRDPTLTDQLMRMYLGFRNDLMPHNIDRVAKIFVILHYYEPDVLDLLVGRLCEQKATDLGVISRVLLACSKVGHVPREMDAFLNVITSSLDYWTRKGENVIGIELSMMKALSILQCYLDDRLIRIFSLDYIELVDDFIGAHPDKQREVENAMMELNRSVVLECPQLDVPWFHETYCRKYISNETSQGGYQKELLQEDIHEHLSDALGGKEFIKAATFSPYFYPLDFECWYNRQTRKPISIDKLEHADLTNAQRVAVLPLTARDFCYNSERLVGREVSRRRHLEMLGYKVVQIPHFTWYSMGLGDHESKVSFLQARILE